jgi:organic radical activating enzyme
MDNKIFWIQPEDVKLGQWQRQITEVTGSPSFCVVPWIHIATRPNGDMRVCCVANASGANTGEYNAGIIKNEENNHINFARELPSEAFNSKHMKSIRKIMLEGNVPSSCTKCFEEEAEGIISKRVWETGAWHLDGVNIPSLIEETDDEGGVPYKLQYLDLRLGHTCNLKCVMCSPHDSSMWVADHKKIFPILQSPIVKEQLIWTADEFNNKWHERPAFWEELFDQIPNIKHLYFAGGEPLLIKEHRIFLEKIIEMGYANKISLRYNTNGLLLDEKIIEIWKQFRSVKVNFSLDGIEERNHYIRYPSDWNIVERNLRLLDDTPDNIHVSFAYAIQVLNIKHLPAFIKWKVQSNFKKINKYVNMSGHEQGGGLAGIHLLWMPTFLSCRILPKKDKEEVRALFAELKIWLWNNYTQDKDFWEESPWGWRRFEGMLDWMDLEDTSYLLPDFQEYITKLDSVRGTDARIIFPELSHLFVVPPVN